MRTSIRDVAERAGVSPVTVSNVLRGRDGRASEETRERVLEAVRELNYTPVSGPAIQSRHVETRIIGLVFDHVEQDDYWGATTYRGLRDGALEHGYDLLTLLRARPHWMLDNEELKFLDRRSDGFVFVVPRDRYGVLETLVEHRIPCVACYIDDVPEGVATVVVDNKGAMRQSVKYLVARGHRKIAHLAYHPERIDFHQRMKGYRAAMKANGLSRYAQVVIGDEKDGWQAQVIELVEEKGVTAFACANDLFALILWNLAKERGWRVPQDLSIVGMDDTPETLERGLTTLRFSSEEVGRRAMQSLVHLINGEAVPRREVLPVRLVERTSVAHPRA